MRPLARTFIAATLLLLPMAAAAQTLTIRDLVALTEAGLSDDVLIALIDSDGTIFRLGPLDVLELKKLGLADSVLVRMIQTARPAAAQPAGAPPRDNNVGNDDRSHPDDDRQARPPVVVQQTVVQEVRVEAPRQREREYVQVPVYVPVVVQPRRPEKEPEPVYWGFGGQRRPDSWLPSKPPEKPKPAGGGGGI